MSGFLGHRPPAKRAAWFFPRSGKRQKHVSASIAAVATGSITPGLKTTNRKQKTFIMVIVGLIYCMVFFPVWGSTSWSGPAPIQETVDLSAQEKESLVQRGVEQYKQGKQGQAQKNLELAKTVFPENYAVPYYLGLIYLEQGKRTAAISQWREYVKMNPESDNALRIRKNLTLLLREEARDSAKLAVANEAALVRLPAADNTVAISAFNNLGSEDIKPLGKGIAALLIHDLSLVPSLQVVERVKFQALLQEMKLGTSGLVSADTAPKVGKLLKAKHVTTGSLADLEKESLQIASAVMDADQTARIGTQEAQGKLKQFYALEKQIACQIIEDLGRDCDEVPAAFHKIHTKSLAALIFFAAGLDYMDREKYDQARESFQKALEKDPSFELAQQALLTTPVPEMQFMAKTGTTEDMITMAATHGVSADTANTAMAAGSGGTTGGVGVLPVVGVVGGTAAIVGLAGAAGDSSSSTGGSTDVSEATENDFVGTYNVTDSARPYDQWHAQTTFNNGGTGTYFETYNGEQYSGTLTWSFIESSNTLSFRTDGAAEFSGTATGVISNFTLAGYWNDGSPGTVNFVRQS